MATAPDARAQGHGKALLSACTGHAASAGGEVWCNARGTAIGFYLNGGFTVVGEPFDIAGIGAHVVMVRPVPG